MNNVHVVHGSSCSWFEAFSFANYPLVGVVTIVLNSQFLLPEILTPTTPSLQGKEGDKGGEP